MGGAASGGAAAGCARGCERGPSEVDLLLDQANALTFQAVAQIGPHHLEAVHVTEEVADGSEEIETMDLRWGDWDASGTTEEYVWVFEISGSAPPEHFIGGWSGAVGERQPAMYFRLGGSTLKGISKPGEIVWSRIYVENDALHMDIGRAGVVDLPFEETQRRWDSTTPQWPIMHGVTYGVTRDQMMAKHKSNHIQVSYAKTPADADKLLFAKAAFANALGINVNVCGTKKNGKPWA